MFRVVRTTLPVGHVEAFKIVSNLYPHLGVTVKILLNGKNNEHALEDGYKRVKITHHGPNLNDFYDKASQILVKRFQKGK